MCRSWAGFRQRLWACRGEPIFSTVVLGGSARCHTYVKVWRGLARDAICGWRGWIFGNTTGIQGARLRPERSGGEIMNSVLELIGQKGLVETRHSRLTCLHDMAWRSVCTDWASSPDGSNWRISDFRYSVIYSHSDAPWGYITCVLFTFIFRVWR